LPAYDLKIDGAGMQTAAHLSVPADGVGTFRVMLAVPEEVLATAPRDLAFVATEAETGQKIETRSMFVTGEQE
jgi:hypothetical protein